MLGVALGVALLAADATGVTIGKAPSRTRTLHLTPAQMFQLAELAQSKSDLATASAVYAALERNPDPDIRAEARFRHAKQLIGQGRNKDAALLLRAVVDEKPDATAVRLELAHTLQLLGETDEALRELRAAQASGLPPAVARLVDRYSQALRASRPFGASLEIALAPDSNINHATRADTLGTVFGDFDIGKESKAKSGTGLAVRGQVFRRFGLGSSDNSMLIRLSGLADLYKEMRFNDIALDLGAGPELRLGRNQLNFEVGATQRWYGQKPFMRSARLGALWVRPLGKQTQLRLTGAAARVDNQFNDLEDGKTYSGRLEVEHALSATTGVGINGLLGREALEDPGYSTKSWRVGLLGWHDFGRATVTAEADMGRLNADERLLLFPDKRADRYSRLSLGVTLRQLQFRGFAPVARFTIERNRSTIEFYDYRRTRSEVGVVRAF
jgi:hypothetical protein